MSEVKGVLSRLEACYLSGDVRRCAQVCEHVLGLFQTQKQAAVDCGLIQAILATVDKFSSDERVVEQALRALLQLHEYVHLNSERVPVCLLLRAQGVRICVEALMKQVTKQGAYPERIHQKKLRKFMFIGVVLLRNVAKVEIGTRMLLAAKAEEFLLQPFLWDYAAGGVEREVWYHTINTLSIVALHRLELRAILHKHQSLRLPERNYLQCLLRAATKVPPTDLQFHVELCQLLCMISTSPEGSLSILLCNSSLNYISKVLYSATHAEAVVFDEPAAPPTAQQQQQQQEASEEKKQDASGSALEGASATINATARSAVSVGTSLLNSFRRKDKEGEHGEHGRKDRASSDSSTTHPAVGETRAKQKDEDGNRAGVWAAMLLHNLCLGAKSDPQTRKRIAELYQNSLNWESSSSISLYYEILERIVAICQGAEFDNVVGDEKETRSDVDIIVDYISNGSKYAVEEIPQEEEGLSGRIILFNLVHLNEKYSIHLDNIIAKLLDLLEEEITAKPWLQKAYGTTHLRLPTPLPLSHASSRLFTCLYVLAGHPNLRARMLENKLAVELLTKLGESESRTLWSVFGKGKELVSEFYAVHQETIRLLFDAQRETSAADSSLQTKVFNWLGYHHFPSSKESAGKPDFSRSKEDHSYVTSHSNIVLSPLLSSKKLNKAVDGAEQKAGPAQTDLFNWEHKPKHIAEQVTLFQQQLYLAIDPSVLCICANEIETLIYHRFLPTLGGDESSIQTKMRLPTRRSGKLKGKGGATNLSAESKGAVNAVKRFLDEYYKLTYFFKVKILQGNTPQARADTIGTVIDVAHYAASVQVNNASLAMACLEALESPPIRRLELSWRNVVRDKWDTLHALKSKCSYETTVVLPLEAVGYDEGSPIKEPQSPQSGARTTPTDFLQSAGIPYLQGILKSLYYISFSWVSPGWSLAESDDEGDLLQLTKAESFGGESLVSVDSKHMLPTDPDNMNFDPLGLFEKASGSNEVHGPAESGKLNTEDFELMKLQYLTLNQWLGTVRGDGDWFPKVTMFQPDPSFQMSLKRLTSPTSELVVSLRELSNFQEPPWSLEQMLFESMYAVESLLEKLFESDTEDEGVVLTQFRNKSKAETKDGGDEKRSSGGTYLKDFVVNVSATQVGKLINGVVKQIAIKRRGLLLEESGVRSAEHWEKIMSHSRLCVERIILSPLLSRLMLCTLQESTSQECALQEKISLLQKFSPQKLNQLLGIPSGRYSADKLLWHGAVVALRNFDSVDLPSLKLDVLLTVKDEIFREANDLGIVDMNADDFLPVMTSIITRANLRHPWASSIILRKLLGEDFVNGEGAYYLTTFEIALNHILSMEIPTD